jgi:hypothetical protein
MIKESVSISYLDINFDFGTDKHNIYLHCCMDDYVTRTMNDVAEEFGSIMDFNTPGSKGASPTCSSTEDTIVEIERFRSNVRQFRFATGKKETKLCISDGCQKLSSHLTPPNTDYCKCRSHLVRYTKAGTNKGFNFQPRQNRQVVAFVNSDYGVDKNDQVE